MKINFKNNEFIAKATDIYHQVAFSIKKASPEILLYSGLGLIGASTVYACIKTVKAHETIIQTKSEIEDLKENTEDAETYKKSVAKVCVKTSGDLFKIYGPAIAIGGTGVTCILASHNIISKRNIAMGAAYSALDTTFKKYRERVVETYGDDIDKELRHGVITTKIDTVEKDPETGKEKKKKMTVKLIDPEEKDMYVTKFDERSMDYVANSTDYNLHFLKCQQVSATNILGSRHHIFLNEVYDMIGLPRTREGQTIGWVFDPENPKCHNVVDLGIYVTQEKNKFGELEDVILLDPNYDGVIMNLVEEFN